MDGTTVPARADTGVDRATTRRRIVPTRRTVGRVVAGALPWLALAPPVIAQLSIATRKIGPVLVLWTVSFTPQLLVLPVAALVTAAVRRRRLLGAAALVVTAAHLAVLVPAARAAEPVAIPADAPRFRVVFSNVYDDNPRLGDALAVLAAQHADVLVLAEAGRVHDADLDRVGLREQLPNEATVQRAISDVVIRSRLPMAMSPRYERRGQPDVRLQVGGEYVRLIGVHTRSAIDGGTAAKWKDEMYTLRAQLGGDDLPLVAIGDFNATRWHAPYRQLADELRDVHDVLGHAFSNSWPNDRSYPPLIRLDHALVRGRLLPVSVHDLDVPGSDHKGLVVELALAPSG